MLGSAHPTQIISNIVKKSETNMSPLRLAIPTEMYQSPLKKSILQATMNGVKGIRIAAHSELKPEELTATGTRQLLHYLREMGLSVAAVNLPLQRRFNTPQHVDTHVVMLKSGMQLAASLKSKVMLFQPGIIPTTEDADARNQLVDILNDVAQLGNHIGVVPTLSVSAAHSSEIANLFAEVTTGQVGFNFDPADVISGGNAVTETARTLYDSILHVTARDIIDDGSTHGKETVIGQGDVDWLEIVALLNEIGFQGWVTVDRLESENRVRDILLGIDRLKNLAGAHGV